MTIVQLSASVSDCTSLVPLFSFITTLAVVVASVSAFFAFCTVVSHLFRCYALITDGPLEQ